MNWMTSMDVLGISEKNLLIWILEEKPDNFDKCSQLLQNKSVYFLT